jgi:ferredoxin
MSLSQMIRKMPMFRAMDRLEDELHAREDVLHPAEDSPERFEILREKLKRGGDGPPSRMAGIMIPTARGIIQSLKSLKDNPEKPRTHAEDVLLDEVRDLAFRMGASSMGYTKVSPSWVFQHKAILYESAIVFAMEMDKPSIDTAPSLACMKTVMETYRDQGRIANKIAALLRRRGFGAHAGHPLMGLALYPPMAQSAGLGWIGLNGIIITPEHGPRVRLAAVFTSINNLPFVDGNHHAWIEGYCNSCRICIRKCPPKALFGEPVVHASGRLTYVDNQLCFPYFDDYYGCSVCVRVCPFNHVPYQKLRALKTHR